MPNLTPPTAQKKPQTLTLHGHTRTDDYYWLREKVNPDVIAHLEAENDYTKAMMAHTAQLQETLFKEMVGRIQETDEDVPVKHGKFFYYTRTETGKQYKIYCRKNGTLEAAEEVVLDLNQLVIENGWEYLKMYVYRPSPDHKWVAYALDSTGYEDYVVHFKNLETGEVLPERIHNTEFTGEWANDSQTYFYTTRDEAHRAFRLHRHKLGTSHAEDELLYQEGDGLYSVRIRKTRDQRYMLLHIDSIETSEIHVLDAEDPWGKFRVVQPRKKGLQYRLDHHTDTFYITHNDDAKNFKVASVSSKNPSKENWVEVIPHDPKIKIDSVSMFAGHMVVYKRENGLKTIGVKNLKTEETHDITFPEAAYTYYQESNPEFGSDRVRFTYMSMTTPDSVIDYHFDSKEMELMKRKEVLGGFDPEDYVSERIFATAEDGAQIPISLVYKSGFAHDRSAPCLLYGYGSYGMSMDPYFSSNRLSLVDRGYVFAIAHIRGGQEMGRHWYEDGKYLKKKNTFTDFITCGRHLIAENYTQPKKLAMMGGSAGGLLMGAVLNMAPDLCRAAVAHVPFVDVVTTMLDESIPLTVTEFEEWGNPSEKEFYEYMLSYSPYDNVEAKNYPDILITAGLNDPRVHYWEPAKWAAKLRAIKTDENLLLLKTNMGAGHGGASGRYDYLKEIAFDYAFILDRIK